MAEHVDHVELIFGMDAELNGGQMVRTSEKFSFLPHL
jgi:hypothetical protein